MVELIARSACEGLLPISAGAFTLTEKIAGVITSIAPERGQDTAVSDELFKAFGVKFPAANRTSAKAATRCVWMGPGQAFLIGPAPKSIDGAAMTDQSDGWTIMQLDGVVCEQVLARLVPVDLRVPVFKRGHTARTTLFHAPLSITRTGIRRFDIMVFRSMTKTVVGELSMAMKSVAAQKP